MSKFIFLFSTIEQLSEIVAYDGMRAKICRKIFQTTTKYTEYKLKYE